jgi:hypothetical protein
LIFVIESISPLRSEELIELARDDGFGWNGIAGRGGGLTSIASERFNLGQNMPREECRAAEPKRTAGGIEPGGFLLPAIPSRSGFANGRG